MIDWYKALIGTVEYRIRPWRYPPDELVVLCLHSTPLAMLPALERLLKFLQRHFTILSPHQLDDYFKGNLNSGPYVLLTFDDGLRNNKHVADALYERGYGACFFIVPDFVKTENQEEYYRTAIRIRSLPQFDRQPEDTLPLDVTQLKELARQGHMLGAHSMSHTMRATDNQAKTIREVEGCKQELSLLTCADISAFCSIVNTNLSVGKQGKALINEHYRYHFTTFPGLNGVSKDARLIFRRNLELDWSIGKIKYALGKADLWRWTGEIERFRKL
jgi:peptidoglycan/xylan/chitin deacetylase (PgdA/CDA1 family)